MSMREHRKKHGEYLIPMGYPRKKVKVKLKIVKNSSHRHLTTSAISAGVNI